MIDLDNIVQLIKQTITSANEELPEKEKIFVANNDVQLSLTDKLDSLQIFNFILDLETSVEEKFGKNISFDYDNIYSKDNKIFYSISSLADYISTNLNSPE